VIERWGDAQAPCVSVVHAPFAPRRAQQIRTFFAQASRGGGRVRAGRAGTCCASRTHAATLGAGGHPGSKGGGRPTNGSSGIFRQALGKAAVPADSRAASGGEARTPRWDGGRSRMPLGSRRGQRTVTLLTSVRSGAKYLQARRRRAFFLYPAYRLFEAKAPESGSSILLYISVFGSLSTVGCVGSRGLL